MIVQLSSPTATLTSPDHHVCAVQSRALLYLFTLTHSVMGAMAAAEQTIELALDTALAYQPHRASQALSKQYPAPASKGRQHRPAEQESSLPLEQSSLEMAAAPSTTRSSTQQHSTVKTQHSDSQPGGLKVRRRSLHQLQQQEQQQQQQQDDSSSVMQPLIARPEGLLRVSVEQRPAKQHFDR